MKKFVLFFNLLIAGYASSQVGIDTATPHQNSVLDIVSKNKNSGVLYPRLTTGEIKAISLVNGDSEVDGLWVYNTDTKCYNYWAAAPKNEWLELCGNPLNTTIPPGTASINCAGAVISGTLKENNPSSQVSASLPYTSGNGGTYSSQSISSTGVIGLTANLTAGTFNNGSGNLIFNITGTPTSAGNATFQINIGGTICSFVANVNGNAIYDNLVVNTFGTYTVATPLSTNEYIEVKLNVTKSGVIRLVSDDKNGILFDSGEVSVGTGNQIIKLKPVTASSGKFPMSAEEISLGKNGSNNQSADYTITNTLTKEVLAKKASIDVKPRIWNDANEMLSMSNRPQGGAYRYYYALFLTNTASSAIAYSTYTSSSWDEGAAQTTGTLNSGSEIGSLDAYRQVGKSSYTYGSFGILGLDVGIGSHELSGNGSPYHGECSETGISLQLKDSKTANVWYANLGDKWYKYRIIWNSVNTSPVSQTMVLYGIYDTKPDVYQTKSHGQAIAGVPILGSDRPDNDPKSYWP